MEEINDDFKFDRTYEEDDSNDFPPEDIISFNELRSCADLNRMTEEEVIDLQPDFQRSIVWKDPSQTRFVDSLIKQLPIPSMCFAQDKNTENWIVIDGLQRMTTINRFLADLKWRLSNLDDIDSKIRGKSVSEFKDESNKLLNKYYKRVQNKSVPITVLLYDHTKETHMEYLYTVFHRLNSEGLKLNNQEIRNCIFQGPFNSLLAELDEQKNWRTLVALKDNNKYRFKKQEIILRVFAFSEKLESYSGSVSKFLNNFMKNNRFLGDNAIEEKRTDFIRAVDVANRILDNRGSIGRSNVQLEATLVGIIKNLENVEKLTDRELTVRYEQLINSEPFGEKDLREGLSSKDKVNKRFNFAIGIFGQ